MFIIRNNSHCDLVDSTVNTIISFTVLSCKLNPFKLTKATNSTPNLTSQIFATVQAANIIHISLILIKKIISRGL